MARTKQYGKFSGKGDIEYKTDFIEKMREEKYEEKYINNVAVKLRKFGEFEDYYGKDVYSFTPDEIDSLLYGMHIGTIGNARFIRTILTKYTDYAKSQNKGNLSLNLDELLSGDNIEKYVSKVKMEGKIISEEELNNIVNSESIKNARDKAFMWLLWLGVQGKEFSELLTLKKTDVRWDENAIVLTNRIIENIPEKVMNILKAAKDNNEYYTFSNRKSMLVDSEYLLRPLDMKRSVSGYQAYMSKTSFLCFFTSLKKRYFKDKSYITAKNIYRSGMLYNFDKYLKEHDLEPTREVFIEFRDKYYQEVPDGFFYDFKKTFEQAISIENDTNK